MFLNDDHIILLHTYYNCMLICLVQNINNHPSAINQFRVKVSQNYLT